MVYPPQTLPSTEAASLTHSPRSHHAGVARRFAHAEAAEFNVVRSDAQSKRRVKKRGPSGGKTCRIRQAGASAVASATGLASSGSAAASSLASATDSASSSVWTDAAVASSSAAPESSAVTSTWVEYATEAASSAPAATSTTAPSNGGSAGTGGWMNSGSKVGLCWPNGDWVSEGVWSTCML